MRTLVVALALAVLVLPALAEFEIWEQVPPEGQAGVRYDVPWPPEGFQWHRMYPVACTYGTQTDHDDTDGDGFVDQCENVQIDGVWKHVEWAGPTIYLWRPESREQLVIEPTAPGGREQYHIINPPEAYCQYVDIAGPDLQVCDYVTVLEPPEFAGEWHVEEIRNNIHTNGGSPVEESTWSKIKEFFIELFN
jgi:hypothetical protein